MAAFVNQHPIDGPRGDTIFTDEANWFNDVTHAGSVIEHVVVNFFINPGDVVGVPFGVWLTCKNLSGVGSAGTTGAMTAQVMSVEITKIFALGSSDNRPKIGRSSWTAVTGRGKLTSKFVFPGLGSSSNLRISEPLAHGVVINNGAQIETSLTGPDVGFLEVAILEFGVDEQRIFSSLHL